MVPKRRGSLIPEDRLSNSWRPNSSLDEIFSRERRFTYHGTDSGGGGSSGDGGGFGHVLRKHGLGKLADLGGGKVPVPGSVVLHSRSQRLIHDCKHRKKVPQGEFCSPDCEKCPKWGAQECLYGRLPSNLAYCDLCPHYGTPGCIFGGESVFGQRRLRSSKEDSQELSKISKMFLQDRIYMSQKTFKFIGYI